MRKNCHFLTWLDNHASPPDGEVNTKHSYKTKKSLFPFKLHWLTITSSWLNTFKDYNLKLGQRSSKKQIYDYFAQENQRSKKFNMPNPKKKDTAILIAKFLLIFARHTTTIKLSIFQFCNYLTLQAILSRNQLHPNESSINTKRIKTLQL